MEGGTQVKEGERKGEKSNLGEKKNKTWTYFFRTLCQTKYNESLETRRHKHGSSLVFAGFLIEISLAQLFETF